MALPRGMGKVSWTEEVLLLAVAELPGMLQSPAEPLHHLPQTLNFLTGSRTSAAPDYRN